MLTRFDDHKAGRIIIAMQRLHPDDLCGYLLKTEPENWSHLSLAAIAEKDEEIQIGETQYYHRKAGEPLHALRHSAADWEALRRQVGPYIFASHYQQRPMSRETGIFNPEGIRRYDQAPTAVPPAYVLQSWDTALKTDTLHDYSACVTLLVKGVDFYVLDVFRDRLHFFDLVERAIPLARRYNPSNILVEDNGGVGMALVDKLKSVNLPATPVRAVGDKIARYSVQAAKVRSHRLHLPRYEPWLTDFEAELFAVPYADHDDQVDALVQALAHADEPKFLWDEKSLAGLARFTEAICFPFWPLH
jgi:predicted phage terminase large subunit-like protein